MHKLFEKNLITTKDAGELSGYTSDYLARLARSGKISGRRIGHNWLIDSESLKHFVEEQEDRKVDYARSLARAREEEYALHQNVRQETSLLSRATKTLTNPIPMSQFCVAKSLLRTQVSAFAIAFLVVVSGAVVARAAAVPQLAEKAATFARKIAFGFDATFGDIPSRIATRIDGTHDAMRARVARVATQSSLSSAHLASPFLVAFDFSSTRMASFENAATYFSAASFASKRGSFPSTSVPSADRSRFTVETLRESALAAYAFLTQPSRAATGLVGAYDAVGEKSYGAIVTALDAYGSLLEHTGAGTLTFAATARDALATTPRLIASMNLALGDAVIGATHALIRADVAVAYGVAAAAPESARVAVAFIGGVGDALASATSRVPALATALFLRATAVPATLGPSIAQAIFDAEYAGATRFVAGAHVVSGQYLALVLGTGNLAYEGTAGTIALARTTSSIIAAAPDAFEDAYLGVLGKSALALDTFARVPKVAAVLSAVNTATAPLIAAVLPSLSLGEEVALATYETIRGFFRTATRTLAALFTQSSPLALSDDSGRVATTTAPAVQNIIVHPTYTTTSSPTYTTIVRGVSEDFVNESLVSLRNNLLSTVTGMIKPINNQVATNSNTIQYVNRIQDLSNLIVRNGDFRGSIFDSGIRVSATTGNFTTLTGGTTNLGATTITGSLTIGDATVNGTLSVNGNVSANYFTATSSTATSTFAGSLAIDTNGFVYATTTKNVGIGVLSPSALLAIQNSTSTQPIFVASNAAGAEVYRITNAGFVGIGTSSPTYALSVEGSSSLGNTAVAGYFTATSSVATSTFAGSLAIGTSTPFGNGIFTVGTSTPLLYVSNTTGRIGIGTSSPLYTLDLVGTLNTSGAATFGSTLTSSATSTGSYFAASTLGTAGAPAYTFSSDLATGLWSPLASILAFSTGGAERLRINSSGNVGIGTSTPAQTLAVQGNQYTSGTSFFGGAITATSTLNVTGLTTLGNASTTQIGSTGSAYFATASGNVGIGTTAPTQKLDVSGKAMFTPTSEAADTIRVNNASGLAGIQLGTYPGAATYGGFWGGNVTAGASNYTFIGNGTTESLFNIPTGGLIAFRINNSYTPNAVQLNSTGLGVNTNSGASRLSVAGNAGIGSSYATIAAPTNGLIVEGNVGIGTSTPYAKFSVEGASALGNSATAGYFTATTSTASLFPYASTTMFTAVTASSTNLIASGAVTFQNLIGMLSSNGTSGTSARTLTGTTNQITIANADGTGGNPTFSLPSLLSFTNASTSQLSVTSNAYFGATATSTFNSTGALTLATPLLVNSGGSGASTLTGLLQGNGTSAITGITGTAGQFPYYSGTNTLLATSTIFLATGGNVGIGNSAPAYNLDVTGNARFTSLVDAAHFIATSTTASRFPYASTTQLSAFGSLVVGGTSTTTIAGDGGASTIYGPLTVRGTSSQASSLVLQRGQNNTDNTITFNDQVGSSLLRIYTDANTGYARIVGDQSYLTLGTNSGGTMLSLDTIGKVNATAHIVPTANQLYDLGSTALYWRNGYMNNVVANNLSSASTSIAGTNNTSFSINSNNTTTDAQDMSLIFYRGAGAPTNAVFSWNSTLKRFEFNQNAYIANASASTGSTTLRIAAVSSQTGPLTSWLDSSGNVLTTVLASGNVGIGTSTPAQTLAVQGNQYTSGTSFFGGAVTATSTITLSALGTPAGSLLAVNASGTLISTSTISVGNLSLAKGNFLVGNDAGTAQATSTIFISSTGNVGIGTASPTQKLDVSGKIALDGTVIAYRPTAMTGTLILGDGGTNLSHTTGTEGYYNTFVGLGSGNANTTGTQNTAVGYQSLLSNTTGSANTANGMNALASTTSGSNNTANGVDSLRSNTIGYQNTANGLNALYSNTSGTYNTANGVQALYLNTTGIQNTVNGVNALRSNTTGSSNTVNGTQALYYNASATSSTAFGYDAGQGTAPYSNQGGTYLGYKSGFSAATNSDYNTLLGFQSGYGVTSGARNVLIGQSTIAASYNQVTTGSNNIAIGNDVALASATASNQLNIGNLIYGTGLSGTGATVSTGNVGIGTTTPLSKLAVSGGASIGVNYNIAAPTNGLIVEGNVGIGTTSPWGKLSVTGAGTGTGQAFVVADSANTPRFTVLDNGTVGIGAPSVDASAIFQIDSTTKGFLPPRMTTAQKNAIASAAAGLTIFDSSLNKLNVYNGSAWKNVGSTEIGGEVTSGTQGSVLFIGDGTVLGQDATNFTFSTSTNRLLVTQASTTRLSVFDTAYFGGTATSSFSNAGVLTLATDLAVSEGGTGASTLTGLLQGNGTSAITGITGTAGQFPYYSGTNTLLATSTIFLATSGNVGIGTSTPYAKLSVEGASALGNSATAGYFTATTSIASTFPYASTTALTISGTNGLQIASALNGPLHANAGLVSATTSVLAQYGGTGQTSYTTGDFLYASATNVLSKLGIGTGGFVLGSVGGVPGWIATTTFSSGLSYSAGNVTNTGLLSLQQTGGGSAQTGAITFATSSQTTNGDTIGLNITNTAGAFTFAPTISGTRTVAGGGTGATSFTSGQLLYGNSTNALTSVATTTFTPSVEFTIGGTLGALVGGANSTLTLATNGIVLSKIAQIAANSILGNTTGATANVTSIATSSLFVWNGTGDVVRTTSPTLITPALGTPSALVGTNITGTGASFTAGTVTTNANLSGVVTSAGNTTSWGSATAGVLGTSVTGIPTFMATSTLYGASGIPNSALANSTISGVALGGTLANLTATDSTLTFSGTYTGATARTIGLNLGNANTWTALQTFGNASTTQIGSTGSAYFATASGNVGIGTTTPTGKLTIAGASPNIRIYDSSSNNYLDIDQGTNSYITAKSTLFLGSNGTLANGITLLSTGNVGIGTTTPARLLHVAKSDSTAYSSTDFDQSYNVLKLANVDTTIGSAVGLHFLVGTNREASIQAVATVDGEASLTFGTRGGGSRAERMRITSAGNVGIGTTSPATKLDVAGGIRATLAALGANTGQLVLYKSDGTLTTDATQLTWDSSGDTMSVNGLTIGANIIRVAGSGNLILTNDNLSPVAVTILGSTGNVGIGTTSPSSKLAVGGSVSANGVVAFVGSGGAVAGAVDNVLLVSTGAIATGQGMVTIETTDSPTATDYFMLMRTPADNKFRFETNGQAYADGAWNASGADYAEYVVPKSGTTPGDYPKGSLICLTTSDPDTYGFCDGANDRNIIGIISTNPAIIGNSPALESATSTMADDHILLAMLGRVPLLVSLENGPIAIGDRLSAASTDGYAMKATTTARTIGIALENYLVPTATQKVLVFIQAEKTFVDNQFFVDVAGNVGIGTTTPNYKLTVAGDIAATAFVNTSTKESKIDINYATASSSEAMLDQLVNLKVATYRYKIEDQSDPLRLGLIAEDAQVIAPEILSVTGNGVDIYKLATFTLSGVQALAAKVNAQNTRLTALETRVAALESGAISVASGSPLALSSSAFSSMLEGFGVLIQKGIAQFNTLVFRQLVASKDADGTSSAGSVLVLTGNTVAQVTNSLVLPSTKVFVTFNSQIVGSWWVSDKATGSFRVVLSAPQASDVSFDYFLVQTEGQMATSTPLSNVDFVSPQSGGTDTTPPVITLLGDNPIHVSVGGIFADPGITVVDNVDRTVPYITFINGIEQPVSTIDTGSQTTYIITYVATDAAGNFSTALRSVIVGSPTAPITTASSTPAVSSDATAPVVTLTGAAAIQITVGDAFTDPGATATDTVDGSLTASVVVTGTVDTTTAGLYTLTYTATDAALNTASVSRVVTVVAPSSTATSTPSGS